MRPKAVILAATAAFALVSAAASADEASKMESEIDTAAGAMGEPRDAVSRALSNAYPGTDVSPYVDCFVTHATPDELGSLGSADAGTDPGSAAMAMDIANRTETAGCISGAGLAPLPQ